jgi:hypothetical protein
VLREQEKAADVGAEKLTGFTDHVHDELLLLRGEERGAPYYIQ